MDFFFDTANYTDFKNILSKYSVSGDMFYSTAVFGSDHYFYASAFNKKSNIVVYCELVGTTDPTPSTISTDFPNAIQLTTQNSFSPMSSGEWLQITCNNYADLKTLMSHYGFAGDVFWSVFDNTAGGGGDFWQFSMWGLDRNNGLLLTLMLNNGGQNLNVNPTPSTFTTDFPNAIQLTSGPVAGTGAILNINIGVGF